MKINDSFKSVSRILFQKEIGELEDFEGFLSRYLDQVKQTKSKISGKEVYYSEPYCEKAKFICSDEIGDMTVTPLELDELKDVDSLLNAVQERFCYAGNKIGGKIDTVLESENCADASNVYRSSDIFVSEHIGYGRMLKETKYMFGCSWGTHSNFCINASEFYQLNRCFEVSLANHCSDAYYSYSCMGCQEILFCFNLKTRRYCIGNT